MLPEPTTNPALSVRRRALTTPSTEPPSITKKRTSLRKKTYKPDAKRAARVPRPRQDLLPDNIGKYVVRDAKVVTRISWTEFVCRQRGRGFIFLLEMKHPARRLLQQYKHRSAPVVLMTGEWSEGERLAALKRGLHQSVTKHAPFLRE